MRLAETWYLASHGGHKPTWRRVPATFSRGDGSPLRYALRRVPRKRAKRQAFSGNGLRAY